MQTRNKLINQLLSVSKEKVKRKEITRMGNKTTREKCIFFIISYDEEECSALIAVATTAATVARPATTPSHCFTFPFLPFAPPPSHLLLFKLLAAPSSVIHLATAVPLGADSGLSSFHAAIHANIPSPSFSK